MVSIKKLLLVFFCSLISSFFLLEILGNKLSPIVYRYVNVEAKRFASNVVNHAVNDVLEKQLDKDLFEITKNANDEVEALDYNTQKVNTILKEITTTIQQRLLDLEDGDSKDLSISDSFKQGKFTNIKNGILCEIPMGTLRGNTLLINYGPKIPIRMSFIGQVQANLNTKITDYGINNLVIELTVHVEVEEQITMPAMSKSSTIKIDSPLTIKIVQGVVPKYYNSVIDKNSNEYSIPLES